MLRKTYIEQIRRLIYGGQPSDDAEITVGLVNVWIEQGIAYASKKNYTDSLQLDGVAYINNSFYSTFKGLTIAKNENNLYRLTLPQIPIGIGNDEGISTLELKDSWSKQISFPIIWLTQNQVAYQRGMRTVPNKILAYSQGEYVYIITPLDITDYTATVTMVSGGTSTDLNSTLNIPSDYLPIVTDYLKTNLMFARSVPVDNVNDGLDSIKNV